MRSEEEEKQRLMRFFQRRPHTFITIMRDCFKARKGNRNQQS